MKLAQKAALINPRIRADLINAMEFPQLTQKYNVRGVPFTVINETETITGIPTEQKLVATIFAALSKDDETTTP